MPLSHLPGMSIGLARTVSAGAAGEGGVQIDAVPAGGGDGHMAALDLRPGSVGGGGPGCDALRIAIKFLLSNVGAGVVIGKAGSNITELQEISGARIQLSRNNVFYPGTVDRVLLLTGMVKNVLVALYLILVKLAGRATGVGAAPPATPPAKAASQGGIPQDGPGSPNPATESMALCTNGGSGAGRDAEASDVPTQLKIVMPAAVCGAIIGRGGETIRCFAEDSGASISVSPMERGGPNPGDPRPPRIVTVTGGVNQILRAVALLVTTVAEDPNYVNNVGMSVNYAPARCGPAQLPCGPFPQPRDPVELFGFGGLPPRQGFSHPQFSHPYEPQPAFQPPPAVVEVSMAVPDEHVGAIIGKGGEILTQLQALVGVRVTIADRGDFQPGTRNRAVCISGPVEAVQVAQMLVSQKLNARLQRLQR